MKDVNNKNHSLDYFVSICNPSPLYGVRETVEKKSKILSPSLSRPKKQNGLRETNVSIRFFYFGQFFGIIYNRNKNPRL